MAEKSPRKNSTFTTAQEVFIIEKFILLKSATLVKTAFIAKYRTSSNVKSLYKITKWQFQRCYDRFLKNGIASPAQTKSDKKQHLTDPAKIEVIADYFVEFPMSSLYEASKQLQIPIVTIHRILRKKLNMKPYKLSLSQALSKKHMSTRLAFCKWLLSQEEGFEQNIIFGDEKWFTLTQHPNRQNTRYWAVSNPHIVSPTKVQGCAKVQAFVTVVDGSVLKVLWHINEQGKNISVNTARYCVAIDEVTELIPLRKIRNV